MCVENTTWMHYDKGVIFKGGGIYNDFEKNPFLKGGGIYIDFEKNPFLKGGYS